MYVVVSEESEQRLLGRLAWARGFDTGGVVLMLSLFDWRPVAGLGPLAWCIGSPSMLLIVLLIHHLVLRPELRGLERLSLRDSLRTEVAAHSRLVMTVWLLGTLLLAYLCIARASLAPPGAGTTLAAFFGLWALVWGYLLVRSLGGARAPQAPL
jgi:hypothetical protein